MKSLTSSFDGNKKTLEQNAAQHKLLSEQIKIQEQRIQATKEMLEKTTKVFKANKQQLDMHKDALTEDTAETERLEKAVQQNALKMQQYQTDINNATAKLNEMQNELKNMPSSLDLVGQKMAEVGKKMQEVGDAVYNVGSKMTQAITAPVIGAFGASLKSAIDWESAFTGVMKTVDETATTTYDDLKASINEIAATTASSQNEIAGVMEIAGQLGVSADEISEFTETVIKLKDTTNMTAEEAASDIAKFANVTNMSLSDIDKFGASIVDLGNNYATTEADIMSMATRLAGAGAQIGLTQGEILGFATAISSVGIEAEMGGSAFSKAMTKMQVAVETGFKSVNDLTQEAGMSLREIELMSTNDTKGFKELASSLGMTTTEIKEVIKNGNNLAGFADVASMKTEDFVELYNNDVPAALQAFIQGLGDTEGHGESTIAMLQEMGFTEVRLRDTLTRLANSGDLVTDAVAQGNTAWGENSALTAEAEKRYATVAAQLQQLKNRFTEITVEIGEMLLPYMKQGMEAVAGWIEKWKGLDDTTKQAILKFAAVAAAIGPILMVGGKLISVIGTVMTYAPQIFSAIQGIGAALGVATGPMIAIVAAIGVLIAAFVHLWNTNEQFRANITATWNQIVTTVQTFITQLTTKLASIGITWESVTTALKTAWDGLCQMLAPVFEGALQGILATLQIVFDAILAAVDMVIAILNGDAQLFLTSFTTFMTTLWTLVTTWLQIIFTTIMNVVNVILSFFGTSLTQLYTTIMTTLNNVKTFIVVTLQTIWAKIVAAVTQILESVREKMTEIKEEIISKLEEVCDFIGSLPERFFNWGQEMMQNLAAGIESGIDWVGEKISAVADKIAEYIHFSEPDRGPLSHFNDWMPDMMKQMADQIEGGRYQVRVAAGHVASDIAAPIAGSQAMTMNNTFTFNGGYTEADGREIVRQINRQLGAIYM